MPDGGPGGEYRWWVDTGKLAQPQRTDRAATPIDARFFDIGYEFEQEQAKIRLTDINLKFLEQTRPAPGTWHTLQMVPNEQVPDATLERIKERIVLPPGGRGLLIDSGRSVRVVLTGEPAGDRVLEFTLGESSSFDCWVDGDWVHEEVFRDEAEALGRARALVTHYLGVEQRQTV